MGEHRLRTRALIVAVAVAVAVAVVGAGLAMIPTTGTSASAPAAEPSTQVLPPQYQQGPVRETWSSGSSKYVVTPTALIDGAGYRTIVRASDGAVVRSFQVSSLVDRGGLYRISGDHAVWLRAAGNGRKVAFEDLDTGTMTEIQVGYDKVLAAHPGWVLTARGGHGPTIHLLRSDGSDTKVDGPFEGSTANGFDSDPTGAIFDDSMAGVPRLIDIETGAVSDVPGHGLTPSRVFRWVANDATTKVTWVDRSTLDQTHTVDVQTRSSQLSTFGNGLVALEECAGSGCGADLRLVNLETGELGETVAGDVLAVSSAADGALVLKLADGQQGEIAVLQPGGQPQVVAAAAPSIAAVESVGLSGHRVVAGARTASPSTLSQYQDDQWAPVTDPATSEPLPTDRSISTGDVLQLAGEVLAARVDTDVDPENPWWADDLWRLTWPAGSRDVVSYGPVDLGRLGKLVSLRLSPGDADSFVVQDARTGKELRRTASRPALDGTWIWELSRGVLTGRDTAGSGSIKRVQAGVDCQKTPWLEDVRGRWALIGCPAYLGHTLHVIDLRGGLRNWRVPGEDWQLGNDFLYVSDFRGDWTWRVRAVDLTAEHHSQVVGESTVPATVDDGSGRRLAYADLFGRVVVRTLDWVGDPAARSDRTAPKLLGTSGSPRVLVTSKWKAPVTFRWRYADLASAGEETPGGVDSYRVRLRLRDTARGGWSDWYHYGLKRTYLSVPVDAGRTICFQVRAKDVHGNESWWSKARCTSVDRLPPRLTRSSAYGGGASIYFSFGARDESGVASYHVQYRIGASSRPWVSPWAWRRIEDRSPSRFGNEVFRRVAVGQRICFRVKATDKVGRRSGWSAADCVTRR
ncbi:hypothetical protein [Nocardioides speluncae]|uniref:hypothetical protein n=1 Tax=Nocardioides speluncae TaxID=2670337 RepID=UPI000D690FCE|nr:hypothetical protein [Nocardioides speluncae]